MQYLNHYKRLQYLDLPGIKKKTNYFILIKLIYSFEQFVLLKNQIENEI